MYGHRRPSFPLASIAGLLFLFLAATGTVASPIWVGIALPTDGLTKIVDVPTNFVSGSFTFDLGSEYPVPAGVTIDRTPDAVTRFQGMPVTVVFGIPTPAEIADPRNWSQGNRNIWPFNIALRGTADGAFVGPSSLNLGRIGYGLNGTLTFGERNDPPWRMPTAGTFLPSSLLDLVSHPELVTVSGAPYDRWGRIAITINVAPPVPAPEPAAFIVIAAGIGLWLMRKQLHLKDC
jgi:hypothetical protein